MSSPAHQRTFSRRSMLLRKVRHDCVIQGMLLSGAEIMTNYEWRLFMADALSKERSYRPWTARLYPGGLWSTDGLFTSKISAHWRLSFRGQRSMEYEPESARVGCTALSKGIAIGAIHIRRREVRPFTDKQINLLETFADQAVIAIENVRLFQELQERNAELREALEHQTATAEVLSIISRSPTDVQPVLDAIVESAARVCGIDDVVLRLRDGDLMIARAHFGPVSIAASGEELSIERPQIRWIREHGTLHVPEFACAKRAATVRF